VVAAVSAATILRRIFGERVDQSPAIRDCSMSIVYRYQNL
jgi:hypothetical protein